MRLVQRGERDQLFEHRDNADIGAHRLREIKSAVYDAMPNTHEPLGREFGAEERDQMIERAVVAESCAFGPRILRYDRPVGPLRDEVGVRVDPLNLAAHAEVQVPGASE